jgi:hypothetical protein
MTSHAVYSEAIIPYYAFTRFNLSSESSLKYFTWIDMHATKLSAIRSLTLTTLPACSIVTEVTHRLPNLRTIIIDVPGGRPIVRFKELPESQHPSFARKVLQSDFYMRKINNLPLISAGVPPKCRVLFVVELKVELILDFPGRGGERLVPREVCLFISTLLVLLVLAC